MQHPLMLLLVLFSLSLPAQQVERSLLREMYQDVLHPSDPLLNGREYKYYFRPKVSSPLIPEDHAPTASVIIRNKRYENVMLLYDTYMDLLVYYNPGNLSRSGVATVSVNRYLIDEFTLQLASGRARFRYLDFPDDQQGGLSSGFYEIVSEGEWMFIIDHNAIQKVQNGAVAYQYTTERFIISPTAVNKIKGKKSLLNAFSDKAEEVNNYLKKAKIQVRSADKEQIKGVIEYYTGLKQLSMNR
jgi:hypothetical protein